MCDRVSEHFNILPLPKVLQFSLVTFMVAIALWSMHLLKQGYLRRWVQTVDFNDTWYTS